MIFTRHRPLEELKEIKEDLKKVRRPIMVWTNGCFDILHKGHEDYLKKARELGDIWLLD